MVILTVSNRFRIISNWQSRLKTPNILWELVGHGLWEVQEIDLKTSRMRFTQDMKSGIAAEVSSLQNLKTNKMKKENLNLLLALLIGAIIIGLLQDNYCL